jgi:hypothetical protein
MVIFFTIIVTIIVFITRMTKIVIMNGKRISESETYDTLSSFEP